MRSVADEPWLSLRPPQPLGKISLSRVRVLALCGVEDWERRTPQPISVDGEFTYAIGTCAHSDALADAVDYAALVEFLRNFLTSRPFSLLENLVFSLCRSVLAAFPPLLQVQLSVCKLLACNGLAPTLSFGLRRSPVVLALGSNLGDRLGNLRAAEAAIAAIPHTALRAVSSVHRTEPLLFREQPEFLNRCLLVETTLLPLELLAHAQAIERQRGERTGPAKGPRQLDIDLLLFEGVSCRSRQLSLPHPAIRDRRFWIEELAELGIAIPPSDGSVLCQRCEAVALEQGEMEL
ncbi:MAG: 2-amino-4-hydroxy-6-hydroxymethyldihydropteridine diphosphokinase [Puniceicoccales bacterium]|jgi:2-amino-4-hydroxy-6-hydroxymethyldihydropteridine diphosphokinase/dihydroneopterin aldolase|nr:2-amino-4-hydroxy-6-hydroxymethyldihydropteridine diphosphokinase [Puniceicoccales bacterium]